MNEENNENLSCEQFILACCFAFNDLPESKADEVRELVSNLAGKNNRTRGKKLLTESRERQRKISEDENSIISELENIKCSASSSVNPKQTDKKENDLLSTMVTQSRAQLNCKVVGYRTVNESYISRGVTYFDIETTSNLPDHYEKGQVYKVSRRFNDFKKLY